MPAHVVPAQRGHGHRATEVVVRPCGGSPTFPYVNALKYLRDTSVDARGLTYSELATKYPLLKTRFDATALHIVTIRTDDIELIEDMFSRLNEAVPLNAPEKRNAFGGPLPEVIRLVARHPFLVKNVPFVDKRYRHRDLAAKFLYVEYSDGIVNTKKSDLDAFVKNFRKWREGGSKAASPKAIAELRIRTGNALARMAGVFTPRDALLRQVGMLTLLLRFLKRRFRVAYEKSIVRQEE